ncbi:hypothetical protein O1611_g8179 [Lasiodiplodia mahajangana]|uniref:Uncharacterized protein n=1 Tax=Lasiodiplodia mahajangana TaxID=1108764 RepID=A0ACC2JE13_9PEZI|nr:hypothetical protein O1611_g8179 [Lasiodiplodia mahajangana]
MRLDALLGLLGAAGLAGLSSAQQYGNSPDTSGGGVNPDNGSGPGSSSPGSSSPGSGSPGSGSGPNTGSSTGSGSGPDNGAGNGSGLGTCPVPPTTTVFITVTPAAPSVVVSTVVSTLTVPASPSFGSPSQGGPNQGGPGTGPFGTPSFPSGPNPFGSPAGIPPSSPAFWSTDYLTLTLPPAPGQATSSVVTYTFVSPADQAVVGSSGAPGGTGSPYTIPTATEPNGPGSGGAGGNSGNPNLGTSPFTITETIPAGSNSGNPNLGTSPTPNPPFTITETIPAGGSGNGSPGNGGPSNGGPGNGGSGNGQPTGAPYETGNYPLTTSPYTITVTVPNGGGSMANPSASNGISPQGPNGPGGQGGISITTTLTSFVTPGPFSGPPGVSSSPPETEAPFSPFGGISPSSQFTGTIPNGGSGSEGGQPLPTITITFPGGSPTGPNGGEGGSGPLQTITVTVPNGGVSGLPQTLTITAPNGSPTTPGGGAGGSEPLQTLTVTVPNGNGGEPETFTITAPNGSPAGPNTAGLFKHSLLRFPTEIQAGVNLFNLSLLQSPMEV